MALRSMDFTRSGSSWLADSTGSITDNQLGKLLSPVIVAQHGFIVNPANHQSVYIVIYRIQKGGAQQLPSKGEHGLNPQNTEQKAGFPADAHKQNQHVEKVICNLLPYQGPYPQPSAGQENADCP